RITIGIRPEHIQVFSEPHDGAIAASVYVTELMGNETFVFLSIGANRLIARAPADFRAEVESKVWVQFATDKANFFDPKSGERRNTDDAEKSGFLSVSSLLRHPDRLR